MKRRRLAALPPFSSTACGCTSARRKRLPRPRSASMAGKTVGSGTLSLFGPGRIFSISPSAPFLDALARAILAGDLTGGTPPGPLDLAETRVYLPNRDACRGLQAAF